MTKPNRPVAEWILAFAVVASVLHAALWFKTHGYLPQPFVFDTNDTFMDWFNTAFWANRPGAFDVWRTIYPPLSFVFLDLSSLPGCYLNSSFYARDCDWLARGVIWGSYALNVVLLAIAFRRNDRATAIPRTVAFALGLPLLFTLERGNLILVTLPFFIIAHGPITRSKIWRTFAAAMTINFKPYLVLPVFAWVLKREWRRFELAGIAALALYLFTYAIVGAGSPAQMLSNTTNWVAFVSGQVWNEINYSTSYAPLMLVRETPIPVLSFVSSRLVEGIEAVVPILIRSTQLIALCALLAAWLQPKALTTERIAALLFGAYLVTQSPGGYTQSFLLFLVMLEKRDGVGPAIAIVCAYLLMLVGDIPLASIMDIQTNSWLSGRSVSPSFGLTMGHFLRPGLIILITWAIALDSIARVIRAHSSHRPSLGLSLA